MNKERFILTIQNTNVFKEVDISDDTPEVRIGTTQDCNVRLKRDLFGVPICVVLTKAEGNWRFTCGNELYLSSREVKDCSELSVRPGDILVVHDMTTKAGLFSLAFSYDFTVNAVDFDTILDIRNANCVVIGNTPTAQVKLDSAFIGAEYISLVRGKSGGIIFDPANAPTSATLNGVRIFERVRIEEYDFIGVADYCFYYKNQVLYTALRSDMHIIGITSQPLRDDTPAFEYPKLNRSPRMLFAPDTSPIEILDPPQKPTKPRDNLVLQLAPALLMMAVIVITRSGMIDGLSMGNPAFLIFSISSMAVGFLTSIMSFIYNRRRYKKDLEEWNADYQAYIFKKRHEIESEQKMERDALLEVYPSVEELRRYVKTFSGRLFERSPKDDDFLHVRAGLGSIPAIREVTCNKEQHIKVENELADIPKQLCGEYRLVKDMPVMLHLRESGSVGVVGKSDDCYEFFKTILLDICVEHSYEELKIIVAIPQREQGKYRWIKWLPHIKESGSGLRGIICDDESRDNIFEFLYSLMVNRNALPESSDEGSPLPHYLIFMLDEYAVKTHPLFQYAPKFSKLGFSFVYFQQYKENLPQECSEIVEIDGNKGVLLKAEDKSYNCRFTCENIKDDSMKIIADRLAPVYCEEIALSSRLTSNISLFELLNILSPDDLNLIERWNKSNVQSSLAVPIGVDVKGTHITLDLHEKFHGPHGLVAGTTGSGKSEIMQSYILSTAVTFHPHEVAFVIIDFKGGGMANQFDNLPHLVGKITDIDSREINRSLLSIRAELEKRKRLFAQYEVNHIDQYIGKYRQGITATPLPHLILIVDEFAELRAEQPDFMKELISTARVGRSLGIHLILATQKPAGQVNEQIWSNSRFKLCLKVATKEDSNEVLKSPLAAELREPGRAYLQVGNNEIFTLFQSAYSGASAFSDKNGSMREFSISSVSFTGKRTLVYQRKNGRSGATTNTTQLKALVEYISNYCNTNKIARLPDICLPPLPDFIDYNSSKSEGKGTVIRIGKYDDPTNQTQPEVVLNLCSANTMIIGAAQTGKTMMLQTMIRNIAENYTPSQVSIYILDFASKSLKMFENLNHVGGVITDADDEKMKNFFKMMTAEIDARKEIFLKYQVSSYESYLETAQQPDMPHIVVMVDNLAIFKEIFQEYEDSMLNICREGISVGITVVATAKQTTGLSYRYFSNFAARLAFSCTESNEYSNVFDRCQIIPKNIQGRGLVSIDKVVYEFQAYLPFDGIVDCTSDTAIRSDGRRTEQIRNFVELVSNKYETLRARAIPAIPSVLTSKYWAENNILFKDYIVPVGLSFNEIEPITINLASVGTVAIYGREQFGKSNLIGIIMRYLQNNVFDLPCEAYLIDDYHRQLGKFEKFGFVQKLTIDCTDFEEIVQTFKLAAERRVNILRDGGNLSEEPLLLCVVQNKKIFSQNVISKGSVDDFKQLASSMDKLKICFIFADVDNNGEYTVPEMMRTARDFEQHFILDDISNVKYLGSGKISPNDLRAFRKNLALGEGYCYDSRNGFRKVKFEKNEEG